MKLSYLIIIFSLLLFFNPYESHAQYFSLGPIVGGGISNVNHDYNETTSVGSYQLGLSMIYAKHEHWGIGVDLLYAKEGFRERIRRPGFIDYDLEHQFHYLRIPIKAIYFFGAYNDKIRPKIFAGPGIGFGIATDYKFVANNNTTESYLNTIDQDLDVDNIGFDLGLQAGAGANFNLGKGKWLNLDLTYYHGLINQSAIDNITIKNYNLRLNVGLLFPIMSKTKK